MASVRPIGTQRNALGIHQDSLLKFVVLLEMDMSEQALEARVRRKAKRLGWRVQKSRTRLLHSNDHGLYQLIDDRNIVIGGVDYDAVLDSVDYWLDQELTRLA